MDFILANPNRCAITVLQNNSTNLNPRYKNSRRPEQRGSKPQAKARPTRDTFAMKTPNCPLKKIETKKIDPASRHQHGMDMDRSFCTPKKTGPVHREKNLLLCSHCHTAAIAEPTCLIAHLLGPHDRAFSPPLYNIQQLKAMAQLHGVNDGKPTGASNGTRERGGGTKRDSFCTHVGNLSWSMPMDRARVDAA